MPSPSPAAAAGHWYQDAVIYELHIKTFHDSDGDGIGDFRGLLEKMPYFEELGVTALWLLPFYPSPLRDDGYDIADYFSVNPSYGTLDDFKAVLEEAHRRGLRVITELVLNHTSDQHPWFQAARRAPVGSPERDFYVWGDDPRRYREARIIFKDFEPSNWTWDPVAKQYFWHRFFSHQPDLNFDNPRVHEALLRVLDFWFEMGIDGMRLDAVPYLYEREGTNCENLPETHAFLRKVRAHLDRKFPGRMLLAEANQWPEDSAKYFGDGDECHMQFHFPLMPRMFMSLQMEDRFPVIDILDQTPPIPEGCQWAVFLRNHDELTLEMVTDEERDYMYRVYAADSRARINLGIRRRLAPLLGNNRRKIELINSLLFSLPGTPILYYGDEIGMGDNFFLGDRNGVRTPMQWSPDRNAGFSRANPQQLYLPVITDPEYSYESINVETQQRNPTSLFWWMRRMIGVARAQRPFTRGGIEFLQPENHKVLAYLRRWENETILVVSNLSRFPQGVELDLSAFADARVRELFGGGEFPRIRPAGMTTRFTLGPHGFYWLALEPAAAATSAQGGMPEPIALAVAVPGDADDPFPRRLLAPLAREALPPWLESCAWFRGGEDRRVRELRVDDALALDGASRARVLACTVTFYEGMPETLLLPLALAAPETAARMPAAAIIARLEDGGAVIDALQAEDFRAALFRFAVSGGSAAGQRARLSAQPGTALAEAAALPEAPPSRVTTRADAAGAEHVAYGDAWALKWFRRFDVGAHPDAELTRHLSEARGFGFVPAYAGALRFLPQGGGVGGSGVAALVTRLAGASGSAWDYASDAIGRFFERVLSDKPSLEDSAAVDATVGGVFPERWRRTGAQLADLHLALAAASEDPTWAPEPLGTLAVRALYQGMRGSLGRVLRRVKAAPDFPGRAAVVEAEKPLLARFARLLDGKVEAEKIRVHGDLSLHHLLNAGKDWLFTDFEGETDRPLSERNLKCSPLVDVASLLRSLEGALHAAFARQRPEDQAALRAWADLWIARMTGDFVRAYRAQAAGATFLPAEDAAFQTLFDALLLADAVRDLGHAVDQSPAAAQAAAESLERMLGRGERPE